MPLTSAIGLSTGTAADLLIPLSIFGLAILGLVFMYRRFSFSSSLLPSAQLKQLGSAALGQNKSDQNPDGF